MGKIRRQSEDGFIGLFVVFVMFLAVAFGRFLFEFFFVVDVVALFFWLFLFREFCISERRARKGLRGCQVLGSMETHAKQR